MRATYNEAMIIKLKERNEQLQLVIANKDAIIEEQLLQIKDLQEEVEDFKRELERITKLL